MIVPFLFFTNDKRKSKQIADLTHLEVIRVSTASLHCHRHPRIEEHHIVDKKYDRLCESNEEVEVECPTLHEFTR